MFNSTITLTGASALLALTCLTPAHAEVDVAAAKALFKGNECVKCHAPDKDKKGPSLQKIAEKYKGKADAQATVIKHFTSGQMVKMLTDGKEDKHFVLDSKDPKVQKNLADWILTP